MYKVCFLDFWGGFDAHNNFITHLIREVIDIEVVDNPDDSDIIVYTCFGNRHYAYTGNKIKIFFTGENIRPDYNQCDISISFDLDNAKNIRIPLWYHYIDWFGCGTYGNPKYLIPVNDLYRVYDDVRDKFCATIYSAQHANRLNMLNALNSYKKVDCYGKIHEFRIPDGEDIKLDILKDYRFSMCLENSIHIGYYTEKLLHAKVAGTIPIYYCDENASMDFNTKSYINLYGKQYNEVVDIVAELDNNELLYNDMRNQPLFNNEIDFSVLIKKTKDMFMRYGITKI